MRRLGETITILTLALATAGALGGCGGELAGGDGSETIQGIGNGAPYIINAAARGSRG